jgi:hypothetical protein
MAKKSEKKKGKAKKQVKASTKKKKDIKMKVDPWMAATLTLVVLTGISIVFNLNVTGFFSAPASLGSGSRAEFGTSSSPVTIDLFVMSQCPYGVQAETGVLDALAAFGSDLQVNVRFIVSEAGTSFNSLHGQPELDENLRQLCIVQNYPDKYFDYLECFNPNYRNAEVQFDLCADQLGMDKSLITGCMDDDVTIQMLRDDIGLTQEYGVRGSPTYYINGELYSGGRDGAALQSYICDNIDSSLSGCSAQVSGATQQPAAGSC